MMRFDRACLNVKGAVRYFRENLRLGDYLTEGETARMTWFGKGAGQLGLAGDCDLPEFERLCSGLHPRSGEKLTVRDKGARRRICFFGQISAPKDVSLAYLVGGDPRIAGWWEEAVRAAVVEIEAATLTRVRQDGAYADRPTGNVIAALVTHDSSRSLDPQLHTHLCIMNLTHDGVEGRWKGLQPSAYFKRQGFFREVCHQQLAARLIAAGYELSDFRHGNFNLVGVPPALRETFSKRRREILAKAAQVGAHSQDALQGIAANTRSAKRTLSRPQLLSRWQRESGREFPILRRIVARARGVRRAPPGLDAPRALASAAAHVFERRSVVDEHELLREALHAGQGDAGLPDLRQELTSRTRDETLLRLGGDLASPAALRCEEEFLAWAKAGCLTQGPLGFMPPRFRLAPDQESAVARILNSSSRLTIFVGDAGTGKTTALQAIVAGIERSRGRVFACAPTTAAAEILRTELTPDASTLQRWLSSERLRIEATGRTLIVDEASLISAAQMRDVCRLADQHANRLLLVGDPKQHHSVEAGDALRALIKFSSVPVVRLQEIRRQRDPAHRAAVKLLADGKLREAFQRFDDLGAVIQAKPDEILPRAAVDYLATIHAGNSCLVISPVWSEIRAFNAEVRARLKSSRRLGACDLEYRNFTSFHFTREQRSHLANYSIGDWIHFPRRAPGFHADELAQVQAIYRGRLEVRRADGSIHWFRPHRISGFDVGMLGSIPIAPGEKLLLQANARNHGLRNGDLVEVAAIRGDRTLVLADGREIPPGFHRLVHGYAVTSHSAQGRTIDRGILLLGEEALRAADAKHAYVAASRFRRSQAIYTTDKRAAELAFSRAGDRTLVTEARLAQRHSATETAAPAVKSSPIHP